MTKILIISAMEDIHAQAVMSALADHDAVSVELLNTSQLPIDLSLIMEFESSNRRLLMRRHGQVDATFDLSEVGAIWWRRPQPYTLPDTLRDPVHRNFAASEMETALNGLYQSLPAFWINDPLRDVAASHKPWQLAVAQQVGLPIPATLMTSDVHAAREFWKQHKDAVIYKQFIALPGAWRETRRLREEDIQAAETIKLAPVIFQRYVDAVSEIRAIVIGKEVFAASTDLEKTAYPTDVRMNLAAPYQAHRLPQAVVDKLLLLMERMGLEYGAVDLRLTREGTYVFLEINPAGQFLYIERDTGQEIASALASHLVGNAKAYQQTIKAGDLSGEQSVCP